MKTEFMVRSFLEDLSDSYVDSYVSARVDAPIEMYDRSYAVNGQFNISDGTHVVSFYIDGNDADNSIKSLEIIEKTLHAFIDKLRQSADKVEELNNPVLTEEIMPFGDLVEGQTLERKSKTLQSDV